MSTPKTNDTNKIDYTEKRIKEEQIYKGGIINLKSLTIQLPDGREVKRDLIEHPGASVVIPLNENGEVYIVHQFRTPLKKMFIELPAGKLDFPGEDPYACAVRELEEETGLKSQNMEFIMKVHSTPGFCNEELNLFLATGLTEGEAHTDEDEFLSNEKLPVRELVEKVKNGEITDAKSIIGILIADKIYKGEW